METIFLSLFVVGILVSLAGGIWLLAIAFQESVLMGLCTMFIPCFVFYFVATHWEDTKIPFGIAMLGALLRLAASMLGGGPA